MSASTLRPRRAPKVLGAVFVDTARCKGCGFCVELCPTGALTLSDGFNAKGYHYPVLENDHNRWGELITKKRGRKSGSAVADRGARHRPDEQQGAISSTGSQLPFASLSTSTRSVPQLGRQA